jgi:hypothetical protein
MRTQTILGVVGAMLATPAAPATRPFAPLKALYDYDASGDPAYRNAGVADARERPV